METVVPPLTLASGPARTEADAPGGYGKPPLGDLTDAVRRGKPPAGGLPLLVPATLFTYGIAAIDDHGRISETALLRKLGWMPGHRVDISVSQGVIAIRSRADSTLRLTRKGLVQIPARTRQWCSMAPGDRVLLVGSPQNDLLVVLNLSFLNEFVQERCVVLQGEASQ